MPDITLSIPEDVYKKMREHKGISWTEVVRKAIVDYAYRLEVGKLELTTEELLKELGKEFAEGLSEISFEAKKTADRLYHDSQRCRIPKVARTYANSNL